MISGAAWAVTEMEAAVDELRSVPTAASKLMASNVMGVNWFLPDLRSNHLHNNYLHTRMKPFKYMSPTVVEAALFY